MRFGSRWQRVQSYATIAAWYNAAYLDDDQLTWRDTPETIYSGVILGLIWSPQIALAIPAAAALSVPLAVVEGAALAGLAASYAIGGAEGAETYVDYITDPVEMIQDPTKRDALLQASEITLGLINPLGWVAGQVGQAIGKELSTYRDELLKNRWLTGPALPF